MTTIQLHGIQPMSGRGHEHVRAFGIRTDDRRQRMCEVHLTPNEAMDVMRLGQDESRFPEVECDDRRWCYCVGTGRLKLIMLPTEGQQ